jgi:hypothetical protein
MDTHENARLTPKGPEDMVRAVVDDGPGELIHIDIKKLGKFNQIASPATAAASATAVASAGNTCTFVSTIIPASPSPTSCPTRRRELP